MNQRLPRPVRGSSSRPSVVTPTLHDLFTEFFLRHEEPIYRTTSTTVIVAEQNPTRFRERYGKAPWELDGVGGREVRPTHGFGESLVQRAEFTMAQHVVK